MLPFLRLPALPVFEPDPPMNWPPLCCAPLRMWPVMGLLRLGVGSNGIHPYWGKSTSTQLCAFAVVTR